MGKIKNWSRRQDLETGINSPIKVWEHPTGEIAWLSDKVPNDGYYFMVAPSEEKFKENRHSHSKRHGYSHRKDDAKTTASFHLRRHEDGFFSHSESED